MGFKLRHVGWVVPMMMGAAAVGAVFTFATHSMAGEDRGADRDTGRDSGRTAARCVSTPLETTDVIDRKTLYVEDRQGNAALITMSNNCLWKGEPVGFEFYGASSICRPIDVNVTGGLSSAVPLRCMVASVELMTREEAKEYRSRGR